MNDNQPRPVLTLPMWDATGAAPRPPLVSEANEPAGPSARFARRTSQAYNPDTLGTIPAAFDEPAFFFEKAARQAGEHHTIPAPEFDKAAWSSCCPDVGETSFLAVRLSERQKERSRQ
jgi:hypothetical protein